MSASRRRWPYLLALPPLALGLALVWSYHQVSAQDRAAQVHAARAASVQYLLRPADFPAGAVDDDFGVFNDSAATLMIGGRLRVAEELNAATPLVQAVEMEGAQPASFALDADGTLLAVVGGYFGMLGEDGRITESVPLPQAGMRVAPSSHPGAVYVFGGKDKDWRLYRFLADGGLQIVLSSNEPIVAVADAGPDIYFATSDRILRIRPGRPDLLFTVPAGWQIRSLAVGADGQLFFSTASKVYALLGPAAVSVVNDAGGSLRVRDGALYVLDPRRRLLFDLRPASSALFKEVLR